jgi:outer membrane lipoprotein SlyB
MGAKRDFQRFGKSLGRSIKQDGKAVLRGTIEALPKIVAVGGGIVGTAAGAASGFGAGVPVGAALGASIGNQLGNNAKKRIGKVRFLQ